MPPGEVVLLRHGETEWSRDGRHTGRTDIPLTDRGRDEARLLGPLLRAYQFAEVRVSPLARARETAGLAGLPAGVVDPDLAEWDYGAYDGRSTPQIQAERPGWSLWRDGVPAGESVEAVGARADRVLERIRPRLADGDVALVGHGHALRVLGARWVGLSAAAGALLGLGTGTLSVLGFEHQRPCLHHWNAPVSWPDSDGSG
jgi:broad specificity phosphatase PhoE